MAISTKIKIYFRTLSLSLVSLYLSFPTLVSIFFLMKKKKKSEHQWYTKKLAQERPERVSPRHLDCVNSRKMARVGGEEEKAKKRIQRKNKKNKWKNKKKANARPMWIKVYTYCNTYLYHLKAYTCKWFSKSHENHDYIYFFKYGEIVIFDIHKNEICVINIENKIHFSKVFLCKIRPIQIKLYFYNYQIQVLF